MRPTRVLEDIFSSGLRRADRVANRLYGWQGNPLYQSGTIVVLLFLVLLGTGLWLLLFYRVGAPWQSVADLTARPWVGNWVRGLHRYASDAAVLAIAVHAMRMIAQRRSWGPRVLAWVTGVLLLGLFLFCGVTGFVMVWDEFGGLLAVESARILDALPVLSEPVGRAFTGERPVPDVFFFLTLFLHVALPLALALGLWLHLSRLARPVLLPPRPVSLSVTLALLAVAAAWPLTIAPEASPFRLPGTVTADWFFAWWVPITRRLSPHGAWLLTGAVAVALIAWPWAARRRGADGRPASWVDPAICTGCRQCSLDCPYDAIAMLPRHDGRAETVGNVDPARCVSCGICAGSCAPMGVGPPGRTGRDQLETVQAFLAEPAHRPMGVVAVGCRQAVAGFADRLRAQGAALLPVDCAGNVHTSLVEYLLRGGATGVLVLSCPPRDCQNREGPTWLIERMYHDREAELQARVDRRRVAVVYAAAGDAAAAIEALRGFQQAVAALAPATGESGDAGTPVCQTAESAVVQ